MNLGWIRFKLWKAFNYCVMKTQSISKDRRVDLICEIQELELSVIKLERAIAERKRVLEQSSQSKLEVFSSVRT